MVSAAPKNWILIRGLARGAGHWGKFPEILQKKFPQDHIYFVDIPGNGLLNTTPTPLKVSEFIPHFEEQLKKQNFNFDLTTYGYSLSLGSMAMVEWAKQKPGFFKKIYISNTSAGNFSHILKRLSFKALFLGFRMRFIESEIDKELASLQLTTTLKKDSILSDYSESFNKMLDFSRTNSAHPKNVLRQLLAASTFRFPDDPPTEVIVMSGAKDEFVSAKCSIDIANAWKCTHIIHPNAGHDISFQYPEWVTENLN